MSQLDNILTWSDVHFYHRRIMIFCEATRPFAADAEIDAQKNEKIITDEHIDRMNEALVNSWNKRAKGKTIYMLGDFSFSRIPQQNKDLFDRLEGDKHLITGNHDHRDVRGLPWSSVQSYKELKVDNEQFILFHYPISSWNNCRHGSYHLHGHVHGEHVPGKETLRMLDVAVDNGFPEPITLREAMEKVRTRSNHPITW